MSSHGYKNRPAQGERKLPHRRDTPSPDLRVPCPVNLVNQDHHPGIGYPHCEEDHINHNADRYQVTYPSLGSGSVTGSGMLRRPLSNSHFAHSHFQLRKTRPCSWRCAALAFIGVTVALAAALAFLLVLLSPTWQQDANHACPLVEDVDLVVESSKAKVTDPPSSSKPASGGNLSPLSFPEMSLGRRTEFRVGPYGHWVGQVRQRSPGLVRFNYTLPSGARLGVFGRRSQLPTHTRYNFLEILTTDATKVLRTEKRMFSVEFIQFLERGLWYISAYNDGDQTLDVSFVAQATDESSLTCPYDCHGHGRCVMGNCVCSPDFAGDSCAYRICPVLCSNHGEYLGGECVCAAGWKGKECQLREYECERLDCGGHGECQDGACRCYPGYKGVHCETVDCLDPDCSDHGVCVSGLCVCRKGWKGNDCNEPDTDALRCLPDCNGHGQFDLELQKCVCDDQWTGLDCSQEKCDLDCGPSGHCSGGECVCLAGWQGIRCNERQCDPRCAHHGQCRNGTCLCIQGWNGKHCTFEGCPGNCHGHGECVTDEEDKWYCFCDQHWDGPDCSLALERRCDDGQDNDNDGLVDCADSECCGSERCRNHSLCRAAADPLDVLLRKQPPAITASFFERMHFLLEEEPRKVALNGSMFWNRYKKSRTSVIRGQVVSLSGSGIVGVRIDVNPSTKTGPIFTQETGWFDVLVNGGGAVKIRFEREPFLAQTLTVMVPWNEIVVVDKVVLQIQDRKVPTAHDVKLSVCADHDYDTMKPVVLATWKHGFQGGCPERSSVLAESQVVQESLSIPGTDLHLVYHSSRAGGYLSTIQLQLTPDTIPSDLRLIHLRISIEGILFEKTFEADPAIKYTYAWNRRNVYRQKVYGVATATVYVGYEYGSCAKIIWEVQTTQVSGHDMSVSDIGGWNLDIHHKYNFHEGILQKGDGNNIYLKNKPKLLLTTMGDGQQRPLQCRRCEGPAGTQRLLAPVALAAGPDGTVYVGDFNLVRRVTPDGQVATVVELSPAQVSYSYHLTVGPVDGQLYISDPERHQVLRTLSLSPESARNNTEAAVGSGDKCLPRDKDQCGDGRPAKDARLAYPKGIAITKEGEMYIADGTNIRFVDIHGIIHTLIGDYFHKSWRPIPCYVTLALSQVNLRWPSELSINPLDGSLHILDDHLVLRVTPDGRLKVAVGRSLQCPPSQSQTNPREKSDIATEVYLESPQSIAFAPNGDLYIAESDSQTVNRVRVVGSDGRISRFAGSESRCSCLEESCSCFDEEHVLATTTKLSTISSITVSPDGLLHICDQGNLRIRSVTASLPQLNEQSEYTIYAPESQEIYVFNRHGQHIATRSIVSGKDVYSFSYNVNTSFGKLSTVTDAAGNKIYILRDYNNQVNTIENTQGGKCRLEVSRMMMLQSFTTPSNHKTIFDYHGSQGLLRSKEDSTGRSYLYSYDGYGRLTEAVTPSGQVVRLQYNLSLKGASVTITRDDEDPVSLLIKGSDVTIKTGVTEERITQHPDGSLSMLQPDSSKVDVETAPNPVLSNPVSGEMFPVPARMRMVFSDDNIQYLEWQYFVHADDKNGNRRIMRVGRKFKRNGELIFSAVFDRDQNSEILYDRHQVPLVTANYDVMARSAQWQSPQNITPVKVEFDQFGRLTKWERGLMSKNYDFDMLGRLVEMRESDTGGIMYKYDKKVLNSPSELILPSGSRYLLQYHTTGGLQIIITPNGHKHEVAMQTSLSFYKLLYVSPGVKSPFVMHFNDYGQLIAKMYPDNSGRVVYSYDSSGRLQTEFCGTERTDFTYQDQKTLVKSWTKKITNLEIRSEYKYQGILLKEEKIRFSADSKLNSLKYRFRYEGQVTVVEVEVAGKVVADSRYRYTGQSGSLEQVQQFLVHRPKVHNVFIQDEQRHFSKTIGHDSYGFISLLAITLWNKEVYSMAIRYDNRGRVKQMQTKSDQDTTTEVLEYTYTQDGYLAEVSGRRRYRYLYDVNGNMNSYWNGERQITLKYDEGDRIINYNSNTVYVVDARGFISSRGEEQFTFNAKSQLINANFPGKYNVEYTYDVMDRLIAWNNGGQNVTQFFYTNPKNTKQVTHVHVPDLRLTTSLFYDTNGHLMYMEDMSANKYFVASDHLGSPMVVFDSEGKIVKRIIRSPFGEIISDSNPHFQVFVDYWGVLRDPYTGLLFFGDRVYQPDISQWLVPRWEDIWKILAAPYHVHMYRFRNNNPLSPHEDADDNLMMGLPKWLASFGYNMNYYLRSPFSNRNMVPERAFTSQSLPVISGLSCAAEVVTKHFARLSASPLSRSKYQPELQTQFANLPSVLGDGVLLSNHQDRAHVHVLSDASPILRDVVTEVLNDTIVVDVRFSVNGQDSFYLVQPDQRRVQGDWDQLQRLGTLFNVTMHAGDTHVDLRLRSPFVLLNIRYGGSPEDEKHRVVGGAQRKAEEAAWALEADLVRRGKRGSRIWGPEEKRELMERGRVAGYEGVPAHDGFPELADDPTAVNFRRIGSNV